MKSAVARIATPALGVALVSGAVVAGIALPAQAATVTAPAAHPVAAAAPAVAPKPKPKPQPKVLPNRYVGPAAIKRYHINAQQMQLIVAAQRFANTPHARMVRNRESHGNYRIVSRSGRYFGAYQFDRTTWRKMGGAQFAPVASQAPPFAQNYIMFRTVRAHGWRPWGG